MFEQLIQTIISSFEQLFAMTLDYAVGRFDERFTGLDEFMLF
jgi:hypothetical protein